MSPPGINSSDEGGGSTPIHPAETGNAQDNRNVLLAYEMQKSVTHSLPLEDLGLKRARFEECCTPRAHASDSDRERLPEQSRGREEHLRHAASANAWRGRLSMASSLINGQSRSRKNGPRSGLHFARFASRSAAFLPAARHQHSAGQKTDTKEHEVHQRGGQ